MINAFISLTHINTHFNMLHLLTHTINIVKNHIRDIGLPKRSNKWKTVEKHFLEINNTCSACGSKKILNVHHIIPFHIDRKLELDPTNLITLCMGKLECHLKIGHKNNYKLFNKHVSKDAANILANPTKFDDIFAEIMKRSD
jgi:5-methylcytosine-specific restriction endonuclease McrA